MLLIGLLLLDTGLKGTEGELAEQLQIDMLGKGGFILWAGSILGVGALGYIPGLRPTSHYLLALIFVVILVRNQQFFAQFQLALQQSSAQGPAPTVTLPNVPASQTAQQSSSGGGGGGSTAGQVIGTVAKLAPLAFL